MGALAHTLLSAWAVALTLWAFSRAIPAAAHDLPTPQEIQSGARSSKEIPRAHRYPIVVVGRSLNDARAGLASDGMALLAVELRYTRLHSSGQVIAQYNLNRDEAVLVLSAGPPPERQLPLRPLPPAIFDPSDAQGRIWRRAAANNWFGRLIEHDLHDRLSTELLIYDFFGWITYQHDEWHQIIGFAGSTARAHLPCGSVIAGVRESDGYTVRPFSDAVEAWASQGGLPPGSEVELMAFTPRAGRWEGPEPVRVRTTGRSTRTHDFRVNLVEGPYTPPIITEADRREIEGKRPLAIEFCVPEWLPVEVLGAFPPKG